MRLRDVMCSCVLVLVACDRASAQPVPPSGPTPTVTAAPVATEPMPEVPVGRPNVEPEAVEPTGVEEPTEIPESSEATGQCCRTCRKGKACGDTCVARDRECTVAPGCACDS